jgi:hypothetical protein
MHKFPHGDAFSSQLFDVLPVKSNTFITDRDIAWPCGESVDLILTFPAEGTHRVGAPLWLVVHPHRSSAFLSYLIALLLECSLENSMAAGVGANLPCQSIEQECFATCPVLGLPSALESLPGPAVFAFPMLPWWTGFPGFFLPLCLPARWWDCTSIAHRSQGVVVMCWFPTWLRWSCSSSLNRTAQGQKNAPLEWFFHRMFSSVLSPPFLSLFT